MPRRRNVIVALAMPVVLVAGVGIVHALTQPTPPKLGTVAPSTVPAVCQADPTAAIQALPAGSIWNGNGACYNLPNGLQISKPVTVENATLNDTATGPTKLPGQQLGWKPVVRVKKATGVNLANLTLTGFQHTGGIHPKNGVAQAGIKIDGSSNVTVQNVAIEQVAGDGLTLAYEPGEAENSNISVNGLTIDNVGRGGVTVSYAINATLGNVTIRRVKTIAVDFESDGASIGSSNVTFNTLFATAGILMQQALQGPVTFNNTHLSGDIGLVRGAAGSTQPIVFNGGTILLRRSFPGTPPAGVWVSGPGVLTFSGVTLGRQPGRQAPTGPAWSVTGGGHLTLTHSPFVTPAGTNDSLSTVTITP